MCLAHALDVMEGSSHVVLKSVVHLLLIPHKTLNILQNLTDQSMLKRRPSNFLNLFQHLMQCVIFITVQDGSDDGLNLPGDEFTHSKHNPKRIPKLPRKCKN